MRGSKGFDDFCYEPGLFEVAPVLCMACRKADPEDGCDHCDDCLEAMERAPVIAPAGIAVGAL